MMARRLSLVALLSIFVGLGDAFVVKRVGLALSNASRGGVGGGLVTITTTTASRLYPVDLSSSPSLHHALETASNILSDASDAIASSGAVADTTTSDAAVDALSGGGIVDAPPEAGGIGYSKVSYYTILGLYVLSFPGLWSTVKRSTTAKIQAKTFVSPGENAAGKDGKGLRQQAGEIMAYMKANNYEVVDAGETITFRGIVQRSLSQAFFLTFCTALGLLSLALVLQIQFQDLELPAGLGGKPNWFLMSLLSPYAGIYYWKSGDRVDDCTVKLGTNDDETLNEIAVRGSEEEIDRMWRTLGWQEKGMVKVEGLLQ